MFEKSLSVARWLGKSQVTKIPLVFQKVSSKVKFYRHSLSEVQIALDLLASNGNHDDDKHLHFYGAIKSFVTTLGFFVDLPSSITLNKTQINLFKSSSRVWGFCFRVGSAKITAEDYFENVSLKYQKITSLAAYVSRLRLCVQWCPGYLKIL